MNRRERKQQITALLSTPTFERDLRVLLQKPSQQLITSLLSFISNPDANIRWRAVIALGAMVTAVAESDLEQGRRIIRRLMWSLNDESGSIGWGAPEAMAEIMTGNQQLAHEYIPILLSYISEEVNMLEELRLQAGVLWGLGRLASVHHALVKEAIPFIKPYVQSSDAQCRGIAAWVLGRLMVKEVRDDLTGLLNDDEEVSFWYNHSLVRMPICEIARNSLTLIAPNSWLC